MTTIDTKLIKITPELAKEYVGLIYEHQRPKNQSHVDYLANAMEKSLFDPTSNIAFASLNGKKVLIDGQHTLWAIMKSGIPQTLLVSDYFVTDVTQIARLYSHFNIGKRRSLFDSIRAYDITADLGLKSTQINQVAAAVRYMKAGFPRYKSTDRYQHEEMIELVRRWQNEAHIIYNTIEGCDYPIKQKLCSAPILAVLLAIIRYSPQKGPKFVYLAHDDGLKKGDPRKALLNYLRQISQHTAGGLIPQSPGDIARAVAKCWGKYHDDLALNNIRISTLDSSKNIVIRGTPYTGKFPTAGI